MATDGPSAIIYGSRRPVTLWYTGHTDLQQRFRHRGFFAAAARSHRNTARTREGTLMPQAVVDPAELRRFAHNLKQFNNELHNQMLVLHGQLVGLGDTWRDQEHEKFVQEFEQTMQVIQRFMESANQHVPFLMRKAERVEEYLQQR
jgi:uncharacterized protein YukE